MTKGNSKKKKKSIPKLVTLLTITMVSKRNKNLVCLRTETVAIALVCQGNTTCVAKFT